MARILFLTAGLFAAFAGGIIVGQWRFAASSPILSPIVNDSVSTIVPDPAEAIDEIERLRNERGSALTGTLLAESSDKPEFHAAIANVSGIESSRVIPASIEKQSESSDLKGADLLRIHAEELEKSAAQYERERRFMEADALREAIKLMRTQARDMESLATVAPE